MRLRFGQQIITIHMLPNISRSKGTQPVNFRQLIEYNMRNIFLEKSYTTHNVVEKLISDPFIKNENWAYLRINSLKCYKFFFLVCQSRGVPKYIKIKVLTSCLYLYLTLVSLPHFLLDFKRKMLYLFYSCYILLIDQISLPDCLYLLRYWIICVL